MKKRTLSICLLGLLSIGLGGGLLFRPSSARGLFISEWLDDYQSFGRLEEPEEEASFFNKLAGAALERIKHQVRYDPAYVKIPYPGGDVPSHIGVCSDVVVRAYRKLGVDLQKQVHEDMRRNFQLYPKIWGLSTTDTNIDHRRVPNLMVFFSRKGEVLAISNRAQDYSPGDLVVWNLFGSTTHIGIVSEKKSKDGKRPLIVHNIGSGPKLEDVLFSWRIIGHFRYGTES